MYGRLLGLFSNSGREEGTPDRLGRYWAGTSLPEVTVNCRFITRLGNAIAGSSRDEVRRRGCGARVDFWVTRDPATQGL